MTRWEFAAVILACVPGCNRVFGTDPVSLEPVDAADQRLLKPPLEPPSCPPPPDFTTWHLAPRTYPSVAIHPTFLTANHVVFSYQERMYEGDLDQPPMMIPELEDMTHAGLAGAAAAPSGDLFWYTRYANLGGGLFFATRAATGGWVSHAADFQVVAYSIEPGSAGFYGGTVRMVAGVQPTISSRFQLVELSSLDGEVWTNLGVLPFSGASADDYDPTLSADGCILLFARQQQDLFVSLRQPDGSFGTPVAFPGTETFHDLAQPAFAPGNSLLWINTLNEGSLQATP